MNLLLDQVTVLWIFATNFAWLTQYLFPQELQLQRKLCWMLFLFHTQSTLFWAALFVSVLAITLLQCQKTNLSYKPHVAIMLKNVYAKIAALRRIKSLVLSDVMISLYKAFVLRHLEYCSPLPLGISKVLKNNIERTNHYASKTLLNLGNSATYDFCQAMAEMDKLELRCTLQSFNLFFNVLN